jgi:hypothetical protein
MAINMTKLIRILQTENKRLRIFVKAVARMARMWQGWQGCGKDVESGLWR